MANCINISNDKFKDLVEKSGLTSMKLEAMMDKYMTENNTEVWPTLEQLGITDKSIKEGVNFVFEQNPELAEIGNEQLYSQYLNTIFPDSKVKDIVYHGSSEKRDILDPSKQIRSKFGNGVSFAPTISMVEQLIDNPIIHAAIINLKNPLTDVPIKSSEVQPAVEAGKHDGVQVGKMEYTVPTKEQIHILGSKSDIDGFKKFVEKSKSEPISDTEKVEEVYMPSFSEESEAPSEFNFEDEQQESEFTFEKDNLSSEDKIYATQKSYSGLTQNLTLQWKDTEDEASSVRSKMAGKSGAELKLLKQQYAQLKVKSDNLKSKIKEANELKNMMQIVDFGNQAVTEVKQILSDPNLTVKGLNYARRIVKFWMAAGSKELREHGHVIFGESYYKGVAQEIEDLLYNIAGQMATLNRDAVNENDKLMVRNMVRKQLGNEFSDEQIYAAMKDIGFGKKFAFSTADYNSVLASAIYKAMARVDYDSSQEIEGMMAEFDSKLKAAEKFTGKSKDAFLKFYQEDNGVLTGDLVKVYSKKYTDTKNELLKKAQATKKASDWKTFKDWSKLNEDYIDIRLLFPQGELSEIQQKMADEHRTKLLKTLGQKQFDRIMSNLKDSIEMYNDQKMAIEKELYNNADLSEADIQAKLLEWDYKKSPYIELNRRLGIIKEDGKVYEYKSTIGKDIIYADKGIKGIRSIAKSEYADGTKTEWYDKKYAEISKDEAALDLYNYIYDTMEYMRTILPEYQRNHIGSNTMPFIEKSIMKLFTENAAVGMAKTWNSIQKSVRVSDLNETEFDELDIDTNKKKSKVQVNSMMKTDKAFQQAVKLKIIEFEATTGKKYTPKDFERFKLEVLKEQNATRSFDLPKVMKAYMATMITHKHKLNMVDLIDVARLKFDDISEISVSKSGVEQSTPEGKAKVESGLKSIKEVLDYTIDNFKNQQIHEDSGKFKDKSYTSEENAKLQKLLHTQSLLDIQLANNTIEKDSYESRSAIVKGEMDKLGGYKMLSKYGDNLLKYNQMKGMGFNVIAGGVNLTTGWMENSIRAADERFFNTTQLGQSYRDVFSTIYDLKRSNATTRKLIGIEKRLRVVSDPSQELYQQQGKLTDAIYIITKKTEFVNCMAFTGAYLRNIPVTDNKGKKSNLYEAFDENGKIKEGWILDEKLDNDTFLFNVETALHLLIKKSHGNYKDPLMGKKTTIGRMIFQFRTWMPEMYESRWGKGTEGKIDPILKKEFKGRWRSFMALKGGQFNGNAFTTADQILYATGQLLRKIAFMRTSFDGRMSEVDAANMKANLMELHFILGTILLMLIAKAAIPDEDKKKNFAYNMFINLIVRQQNDIMVFANPLTFEQINKNLLPVFGVMTDTKDLVKSIRNEFSDDNRKTGKSLEKLAKAIPGAGQAVRIAKYGAKEMVQQ